ncbi:MAG: GNAT family N-acetyltransferase [Candidatus Stygibacter australis]|nr:GNAT family N-acetyltransferase [Candidatus Stygibacter australis]MDP8322908.1 GNAT family N-acetyltransferase [Candidatus Stygibacter australis]
MTGKSKIYTFLTSTDIDKILKLWQTAGLSYRPKGRDTKANILKQMQKESTQFMGIIQNDELIAVAIASHNGRKGWVNRLAVHSDHRRMGIASQLIRYCEEWLADEGIEIIAVLIESDNPDSLALFDNNDYTRHDDIIYFTKKKYPGV